MTRIITMKRLHIVGSPRSGTTLIMELFVTCFQSNGFCEHEMSIFDEPELETGLFLSKQPTDVKYIEKVFKSDPNLFVVYILRDPRSVITSIHISKPHEYFCNYRIWKECNDAAQRIMDSPRFLTVRYEDLVQNPNEVQRQIVEKFPLLKKKCDFSGFEKFSNPSRQSLNALSGLRPICADRVNAWQKHLPRIKSELNKHPQMLKDLIENGYETDNSWTDILEGIGPIEYSCRYPDSRPILKTIETRFRKWVKSRQYIASRNLR